MSEADRVMESDSDLDDWEQLSQQREILEYISERDLDFSPYAERLLDALERREL